MSSEPVLRLATRALIIDERERVLLVRFEFPDGEVWAAPGGGIDDGESDHDALRRELLEEVGLADPVIGPLLWIRTHLFRMTRYDGQRERVYLVRAPAFDPAPRFTAEQLAAEGMTGSRWWTAAELASSIDLFSPRRLPALVAQVLACGPPATPLEIGL
jgi:8-oxo-dGTP pyrophosphatase MutT (NUDIX family)